MASAYPIGSANREKINRITRLEPEWPTENTQFKDGSKTFRACSAAPRQRFRLEYDRISTTFFATLKAHNIEALGPCDTFTFTESRWGITMTARYETWDPSRRIGDPVTGPCLDVVLVEEI